MAEHSAPTLVTHTTDRCGVEAGTPHACVYIEHPTLGPLHPILFVGNWVEWSIRRRQATEENPDAR